MSKDIFNNNNNSGNTDYPEMLQNSITLSSYNSNEVNAIEKSDEELSLRPAPPVLPLAPPVSLLTNNSIDTHIAVTPVSAAAATATASLTTASTSKELNEKTENVSESPRKEFFLDASFGPTPSSYYFYSDNYQNFDEELYTFEEFLGAPDTPKEEKSNNSKGEFDSIPLDSPQAGPSVERNSAGFKIRDRSYTPDIGDDDSTVFSFQSHSRQSHNNGDETSNFTTSTNANNLPIADLTYADAHQASPAPLNLGPLPLPPRNQSTNIGSDEMGFLRIFCCLRPQNNRASRYHVAAEEAPTAVEELQQSRPQYSWDLKKANPSEYTFSERKSEVIIKKNDEINGQQFVIDNCTDCVVILLDHSGAITVDDAKDSLFVFGPCSGSVFIRNCTNCYFYSICKQFRVRDSNIITHLFCATPPVIEESKVDFFPLYMNYDNLDKHMIDAGLSPFYNCWSQVYDFTPDKNTLHFRINYETPETEVADKLELIASAYQLTFVRDNSYFVVPELSKTIRIGDEIGIVIHKKDESTPDQRNFLNRTRDFALNVLQDPSIILINTTDLEVQKGDLQSSLPHGLKLIGHIVVLEFTGKNCCKVIAETITKFTKDENKKGSFEIIQQNFKESLYRFAEMKRSV